MGLYSPSVPVGQAGSIAWFIISAWRSAADQLQILPRV